MNNSTGTRYGASPEDWSHLESVLELTEDLLPVVSRIGAEIHPTSSMTQVGKTPSRYFFNSKLTQGIAEWTKKKSTSDDIAKWKSEPDYGICIQTRTVRAIDVDIEDLMEAIAVHQLIKDHFGILPARIRENSSKFLVVITLPGDYNKRVIKTPLGMVEFLATGQQFIAVGTHTSGVKYEWNGGLPAAIPEVTGPVFEAFWSELEKLFAVGPTMTSKASNKTFTPIDADTVKSDPVAQRLKSSGMVLSQDKKTGRLDVKCPFGDQHGSDNKGSSTSYFPGLSAGAFKCLHATCTGRSQQEFLDAIGFSIIDEFEVLSDEPKKQDGDVSLLFSDVALRQEDVQKMANAEFLIPNMIVRGHVSAYVAPGNGGKTTIFIYLCEKLSAMGMKVLYINVDGSPDDLKRHHAHATKHGYQVIAPDARDGKSTGDVLRKLQAIADGNYLCNDYVFILDTLKKFIDVIDKRQAKGLYKLMRTLTVKGATICLLGHCNKYKDDDGKAIFEGTADLRNDLDELIYLDSFKNEKTGRLEITTRPDKVRADFKPKSFVIDLENDRTVSEPDTVFKILNKEERELLDLINSAIRAGSHSQKDVIEWVRSKTTAGDKKIRNLILHHSQGDDSELVVENTGRGKDLHYKLREPGLDFVAIEDEEEEALC